MKIGFKIILESLVLNHASSVLAITPIFPELSNKTRNINTFVKEMATIYARLINQNYFKYRIIFSASFYRINEEDQRSDGIEIFIDLNINHSLTETDIKNIDVKSQL